MIEAKLAFLISGGTGSGNPLVVPDDGPSAQRQFSAAGQDGARWRSDK
jgi:hypothetical protein